MAAKFANAAQRCSLHGAQPQPRRASGPAVHRTHLSHAVPTASRRAFRSIRNSICMASSLQFVKGVDEPCVPDIKLTRSRDGSSGTATFLFQDPAIFEEQEQLGDITGLYMIDDEGSIMTVEVSAKFVNGKPDRIEAFYIMKTAMQWDRFMRFMDRYAEDHGLGFNKKK